MSFSSSFISAECSQPGTAGFSLTVESEMRVSRCLSTSAPPLPALGDALWEPGPALSCQEREPGDFHLFSDRLRVSFALIHTSFLVPHYFFLMIVSYVLRFLKKAAYFLFLLYHKYEVIWGWRPYWLVTSEDLSSHPSIHMGHLTATCNPRSWRSGTLFWPLRRLHSHGHTHTSTHVYTMCLL